MLLRAVSLVALLGLVIPAPALAGDDGWEEIAFEEGIRVWQREVPGSSFVEFRGHGFIDTKIQQVLAVMHDQERKKEWLASCRENRLVRAKGLGRNVIYNRIASTFPLVDDRDVVIETSLAHDISKREVKINVWSTTDPLVPVVDGVVRMPSLKLSWTLVAVNADRTEVTYQVAADPGGMLPGWVVNMVSKMIPYKTISNLRQQVKKDGYEKNLAVVEASFDWETATAQAKAAAAAAPVVEAAKN